MTKSQIRAGWSRDGGHLGAGAGGHLGAGAGCWCWPAPSVADSLLDRSRGHRLDAWIRRRLEPGAGAPRAAGARRRARAWRTDRRAMNSGAAPAAGSDRAGQAVSERRGELVSDPIWAHAAGPSGGLGQRECRVRLAHEAMTPLLCASAAPSQKNSAAHRRVRLFVCNSGGLHGWGCGARPGGPRTAALVVASPLISMWTEQQMQ
jgi:hypothetical protein